MFNYWWLLLAASGVMFGTGAIMWLNAATAMVRVVAPSTGWLEKESKFNMWGARLMTAGAVLAVISITIAVGP